MKVVCIGSGYVGSVTAAAFAEWGHDTTVIDLDPRKVATIQAGKSPIYEPGLEELIARHAGQRLQASSDYDAVADADAVYICVGTPAKPDGSADLSYVRAAAEQIGRHLGRGRFTVIVGKSTVPVGTSDMVTAIVERASGLRAEQQFTVASNPEFLREGYAVDDVFAPDRIVVGTVHAKARALLRKLYRPVLGRNDGQKTVYVETEPKSAELIKYASNAFLAVKISYINEMARLCEALGADVAEVAHGMGLDSRIGSRFLQVSSGWSGSCFPKDSAELLAVSRKYGCELEVLEAAVRSNIRMHQFCVEKLCRRLKTLTGKTVGVLGLTFKPDTDDARQTQAAYVVRKLTELGADVRAHDPQGMEMFRQINAELPITYCITAEEVADRADALVLMTHWSEYLRLDWQGMKGRMKAKCPYVLDTRNFLPKEQLRGMGFVWEGLGATSPDHD